MKDNRFQDISSKLVLTLILILGFTITSKSEAIRTVIKEDLVNRRDMVPTTYRQEKYRDSNNSAWNYVLKNKWKLIQMNGVTQVASPIYMIFNGKEKRVSGNSGCNTFFGGYERNEGSLTFKQMAGTMMACSEELNKLEHQFLTLMGDKTFKYDVADQTLNFYQDNKLVLMFGVMPL